jgi:hypothetical protein
VSINVAVEDEDEDEDEEGDDGEDDVVVVIAVVVVVVVVVVVEDIDGLTGEVEGGKESGDGNNVVIFFSSPSSTSPIPSCLSPWRAIRFCQNANVVFNEEGELVSFSFLGGSSTSIGADEDDVDA